MIHFAIPFPAYRNEKNGGTNSVSTENIEGQNKKLKILISEDDKTSDFIITRMLKKIIREVLHAKNGVVAIGEYYSINNCSNSRWYYQRHKTCGNNGGMQ